MTHDTPRSRSAELTRHQRLFAKAFSLMRTVAVVNFVLWALILSLEMAGIPVDSSAYVVFGICLLVFVAALGVRFYCLACFVGGVEIRGRRELFFVPREVPDALAQRLFTAANLAAWDCFMGILAGYTLRITPIRTSGSMLFSSIDASGTVVAVIFCLVLFAVIALKTLLLLMQACGWTALYDPRERTASAEVKQRSPHAMKALVVLRGVSRQAALALCAILAFLPAATTLSRNNALFVSIPAWSLLSVIATFIVVMLARLAVIAWCFSRYSIRHVLGFNLAVGACVSLAMSGPPGVNTAAGTCAALITFVALGFIAMQDPEGDVYTPAFIRERMREQRRERYQAKLKQNLQRANENAIIKQRELRRAEVN